MDMLAIILGLVILLVLTLKKIPVTVAALISIIFIALLSGMNVLTTVTEDYMGGLASFVQSSWLMLLLGAILSKLMDMTGAARSLATVIINKLGEARAIPAIILAGALLTYGGVSSMVACFALYPIALAIFRKANLPRYLIPASIGAGIFTWVTMLPGNPSIQNIIPTTFLPTTPMAAPVVGIIAAVVTFILQVLYFGHEIKKARKNSIGFQADADTNRVLAEADKLEAEGKVPNPILSVLPIIAIAVVLNVFNTDITVALLSGIVLCALLFIKNLKGKEILQPMSEVINSAASTTITASAIVGIGSVVKVAPGFEKIVDFILNFTQSGGNPLLIFGIATTLLCGLNASGMGGLSTTLSALGETFINMGVNPEILHRVGVIASTGLDSLPHSGGIVAVLAISGISYKDGYKHLFATTVVITLIAMFVSIIIGNIMYPIVG